MPFLTLPSQEDRTAIQPYALPRPSVISLKECIYKASVLAGIIESDRLYRRCCSFLSCPKVEHIDEWGWDLTGILTCLSTCVQWYRQEVAARWQALIWNTKEPLNTKYAFIFLWRLLDSSQRKLNFVQKQQCDLRYYQNWTLASGHIFEPGESNLPQRNILSDYFNWSPGLHCRI